jgi:hypothetical protein
MQNLINKIPDIQGSISSDSLTGQWLLQIQEDLHAAPIKVYFAPIMVNGSEEILKQDKFEINKNMLEIQFSFAPYRGTYERIYYRTVFQKNEGKWQLYEHTIASRYKNRPTFQINQSKIFNLKLKSCESLQKFDCPADTKTTPLLASSRILLNNWPGLLEYSPKPDVMILIR